MRWQECFEKYEYESLIYKDKESGDRKLDIAFFLNKGKVPDQLREVYISSRKDEVFLVIELKSDEVIGEVCNYWDSCILAWLHFGQLPGFGRKGIDNIKYNITMLLLYNAEASELSGEKERHFVGTLIEKSTSISRKILINCDNDELDENNMLHLPFWYDSLREIQVNPQEMSELENLLPIKGMERCLYKKREKIDRRGNKENVIEDYFTEEEFQAVKGWLES